MMTTIIYVNEPELIDIGFGGFTTMSAIGYPEASIEEMLQEFNLYDMMSE